MSAGSFVTSRYAATYNATNVHPIRVQPETLAASAAGTTPVVNAAPTAAVNNPIQAKVSGSKKSLGLTARSVSLRIQGAPPAGYFANSVTRIPALTQGFFTACAKGVVVTYLGTTWTVIGRSAEYPV